MDITIFELGEAVISTILDVWTSRVASRLGDLTKTEYRERVQSARETLVARLEAINAEPEEKENADKALVSQAEKTFRDYFGENPELATERAAAEAETRAAEHRVVRM